MKVSFVKRIIHVKASQATFGSGEVHEAKPGFHSAVPKSNVTSGDLHVKDHTRMYSRRECWGYKQG